MELYDLMAGAAQSARSTPDLVAHALREAIITGLSAAGQPLRQDELASALRVSKIPVREALRRLEAEGLVVFHTNRGAMVAPLDAAQAVEIAEIRVALEVLALQLAIPNLTARDLRRAQSVLEELDAETDRARWGTLNRDFHHTLYTPARRPQLLDLITTQHQRFDRCMRVVLAAMEHQAQSQSEHRAILAACAQPDPQLATSLLAEHITAAARLLAAHLRPAHGASVDPQNH